MEQETLSLLDDPLCEIVVGLNLYEARASQLRPWAEKGLITQRDFVALTPLGRYWEEERRLVTEAKTRRRSP